MEFEIVAERLRFPEGPIVHQAADAILRKLDGGRAGEVWDEATPVFQQQEPKAKFIQLQLEHLAALGGYRRIIAVTEAKLAIGGASATFDALAEFEKASGVRMVFAFCLRLAAAAAAARAAVASAIHPIRRRPLDGELLP